MNTVLIIYEMCIPALSFFFLPLNCIAKRICKYYNNSSILYLMWESFNSITILLYYYCNIILEWCDFTIFNIDYYIPLFRLDIEFLKLIALKQSMLGTRNDLLNDRIGNFTHY